MVIRSGLLVLAIALCAASLSAQQTFELTTGNVGTTYVSSTNGGGDTMSIECIGNYDVRIKRVSSQIYSAVGNGTNHTCEVWYKQGADRLSSSGWTKIPGNATVAGVQRSMEEWNLDIDIIIRKGEIYSFVTVFNPPTYSVFMQSGTHPNLTDANISMHRNGAWGYYDATNGFSMQGSGYAWCGTIKYEFAANRWNGTVSNSWNNAANWSLGIVPSEDESVEVPTGTPYVLMLPSSGRCKDLELTAGATLDQPSSGSLVILGNLKNAGTINVSSGYQLMLDGDIEQNIVTGNANLGNLTILNDDANVSVTDPWTSAQAGNLVVTANAVVAFASDVDVTKCQIANTGTIRLGIDGAGLGSLQNVLARPSVNFGKVIVNTINVNDAIDVTGDMTCGDMTISGSGFFGCRDNLTAGNVTSSITFTGAPSPYGTTQVLKNANLTSLTLTNNNPFAVSQNLTVTGAVTNTDLGYLLVIGDGQVGSYTGASQAALEVQGAGGFGVTNFMTISDDHIVLISGVGSVTGSATANITLNSTASSVFAGTLEGAMVAYRGTGALECAALAGGTIVLEGTGPTLVNGSANVTEFYSTGGDVTVNAVSADLVSIDKAGMISVVGPQASNVGDFQLSGTSTCQWSSPLRVSGDFLDTSSGNVTFGRVDLTSPAAKQEIESINHPLNATHIRGQNPGGALLRGRYTLRGNSGVAIEIQDLGATSGYIELAPDSVFDLGSATSRGMVIVAGVLECTSYVDSSRPLLRGSSIISRASMMRVTSTGMVAVNGLVLDTFGTPTDAASVSFEAGSVVAAFNNVAISNGNASNAIIQISTDQLPGRFNLMSFEGSATYNMDAVDIGGMRLEIGRSGSGGTRYGDTQELDPNDVLIWDDPSPVVFLSDAKLPRALVGDSYTVQLQAAGGNRPRLYTATGLPDWLTLDPDAGLLYGIPAPSDFGISFVPITVTDASTPSLADSRVFQIQVDVIADVPVQILSPNTLSKGVVGDFYSYNLIASGGTAPYDFRVSSGTLPAGIALSSSGQLMGTPIQGQHGTHVIRIRAADAQGDLIERDFTIQIAPSSITAEEIGELSGPQPSSCSMSAGGSSATNWLWLGGALVLAAAGAGRRKRRSELV